MAARRRWFMTGPWPHPKTGILYFRKAIPADLYASRARLTELGIAVTREVQRSLGTKDRKAAERSYKEIAAEFDREWDWWRALLRDGPIELDHMNTVALAGESALTFLEAHKRNPHLAPSPKMVVTAALDNVRWHYARRSLRDANAVLELRHELSSLGLAHLLSRLQESLAVEPEGARREALKAVGHALISWRYAWAQVEARAVSKRKGIAITSESRKALTGKLSAYHGKAWDKLNEYLEGDYRAPAWAAGPVASTQRGRPRQAG